MVVITNMGTAVATRLNYRPPDGLLAISCQEMEIPILSSYNGKEIKRVSLLNIEILCQKGGLSPISLSPLFLVPYFSYRSA